MEFPTFISWTSPTLNQGLYGGIHISYSDFNRTFFLKKNVENLIRCPRKSLNELMSSRLFFRSSFHSLHQIDSAKRRQFSHYIIGNKLKPYN